MLVSVQVLLILRSGDLKSMAAGEFSRLLVSHWRELHEKLRSQDESIIIDGRSLSVASVVACARYVFISSDMVARHSWPSLTHPGRIYKWTKCSD